MQFLESHLFIFWVFNHLLTLQMKLIHKYNPLEFMQIRPTASMVSSLAYALHPQTFEILFYCKRIEYLCFILNIGGKKHAHL